MDHEELVAENERLRHLAYTDRLTELRNRNALEEHVARLNGQYAVLLIDADAFKELNDTHGHQAGDDFLRVVGKAIAAVVRCTDAVGYRRGGDEFVVILEGASRTQARIVGERIRGAVMALSIDIPSTTVTIGAAAGDRPFEAIESEADFDMYQRKSKRGTDLRSH